MKKHKCLVAQRGYASPLHGERCQFESDTRYQIQRLNMKLFEATVRVNGREFTDRVGANDAQEARLLLQQRHGPRAVPFLPRMIPS